MSPSPADPTPVQVLPACMGSEQGDPPPRGRAVAAEPRGETAVLPSRTRKFAATPARPRNRDTARNRSPPPSAQKRRSSNSPADVSVPKRAFRRDSGAAADASQSPERRALHTDHAADGSQNSNNSETPYRAKIAPTGPPSMTSSNGCSSRRSSASKWRSWSAASLVV